MHTFMEHTCLSKLLTCNQVSGARAVLHYGIIPTFPRSVFLHLGIGEICIAGVLVVLSFVVGVFSNYTCVGDVAAANNGVQYGSKLRVNLYNVISAAPIKFFELQGVSGALLEDRPPCFYLVNKPKAPLVCV